MPWPREALGLSTQERLGVSKDESAVALCAGWGTGPSAKQ